MAALHRTLLCFLLFLFVPAITCHAHDPLLSSIQIIHGAKNCTVSVTTRLSQLQTVEHTRDVDTAIRKRLKLRLDGKAFLPGKAHLAASGGNGQVQWQADYNGAARQVEISAPLFPENTLARTAVLIIQDGRVTMQGLLDSSHPAFHFPPRGKAEGSTTSIFAGYLREGIQHILTGYDHVLFVLGLLLFGGTLKGLFKTITAFTLAHSLTLSLTVLGFWSPSPRVVEPLIALSIVAIAVENLFTEKTEDVPRRDWRPLVAFAFGLVHGAGFAGALTEVGLPRAALGWALAAFNLGVEVGQASIILVAWPLLQALSRRSQTCYGRLVTAGSLVIAGIGAFWFTQRLFGA